MKKILNLAVTFFAFTVLFFSLQIKALAVEDYEPYSSSDTAEIIKYFVMDEGILVPTVSFEYEITGESIVIGEETTIQGPESHKITISSADFNADTAAYSTVRTGDALELPEGSQYCKASAEVLFNGVTFTEPGIYTYKVTEIKDDAPDGPVIFDESRDRYLVVQIGNDPDEEDGYKLKTLSINWLGEDKETKTNAFTNSYRSTSLSIKKQVQGNGGRTDKYFCFTVSLSNILPGTRILADLEGADAVTDKGPATKEEYREKENVLYLEGDENGNAVGKFYLKDGQYITLKGIPYGSSYAVTEDPEDYTSAEKTDDHTDDVSGTAEDTEIKTGYTNTLDINPLLGIVRSFWPLILVAAGIIGIAAVLLWGRKRADHK